jgi:hypothetical protein
MSPLKSLGGGQVMLHTQSAPLIALAGQGIVDRRPEVAQRGGGGSDQTNFSPGLGQGLVLPTPAQQIGSRHIVALRGAIEAAQRRLRTGLQRYGTPVKVESAPFEAHLRAHASGQPQGQRVAWLLPTRPQGRIETATKAVGIDDDADGAQISEGLGHGFQIFVIVHPESVGVGQITQRHRAPG